MGAAGGRGRSEAPTRDIAGSACQRLMYFLYTSLILVLFVVFSPLFLYQAVRYKKYTSTVRQRLGYLPVSFNVDGDESIWIHAL